MPSEIKPKQKGSCQGIKKMQNRPGFVLHARNNELARGFLMIPVSRETSLEGCSFWRAPQGPAHGPGLHHICANGVEGNSILSLWKTLWMKRRLREWKKIKRKAVIKFSVDENQFRLEYNEEYL